MIKTKVITVTPAMAKQFLDNMVKNRPVTKANVDYFIHSIQSGQYAMTGQPIIFSPGGKLLDGQHRCLAVIKTDTAIQVLAVYGIAEEMFTKLDKGRPRTFSDCIPLVPNNTVVAAAVKLVYTEETSSDSGFFDGNKRPTNDDLENALARHPGVIEAASFLTGRKTARRFLGGGGGSYCLYRMASSDKSEAHAFISALNTGAGLSARSPILSLRELLNDGKTESLSSTHRLYLTHLAWQMHIGRKSGKVTIEKAKESWNWWGGKL